MFISFEWWSRPFVGCSNKIINKRVDININNNFISVCILWSLLSDKHILTCQALTLWKNPYSRISWSLSLALTLSIGLVFSAFIPPARAPPTIALVGFLIGLCDSQPHTHTRAIEWNDDEAQWKFNAFRHFTFNKHSKWKKSTVMRVGRGKKN